MNKGINGVICILSAMGAPVREDYHTIIKATSSEGSVPASVAPGHLQKQGRKEAPCRVSSHLQGRPCGRKSVPGPPAGLGPPSIQRHLRPLASQP